MYEARIYRDWAATAGLVSFTAAERETDLMIRAHRNLTNQAQQLIRACRREIEAEIARRPEFMSSLAPLPKPSLAGKVVAQMYEAAREWQVGPMAAVAGAVAAFVGEGLILSSPEVIVENGGDIWLKMNRPIEVGLYAGADSPFSGVIRLRIDSKGAAMGVCTSSGTVGHSLSFGKADAVVCVAEDAAMADAAATALCNKTQSPADIQPLLEAEQKAGRLKALVICFGRKIGAFGDVEIIR